MALTTGQPAEAAATAMLRRLLRAGAGVDGRALVLAALAIYLGAWWHWDSTQGWRRAWLHLRVPALEVDFVDARAVLSAFDRFRAGAPMDQVQSPPSNGPRAYTMTYPRTWLAFAYLGPGESATYPVVLTLIGLCFGLSLWYVGRLTLGQAAVYAPIMVSPSLMLAVERGNVDLLMYLMVLAACWLFGRRAVTAACAVLFGAGLLKLYPVAAMAPALRSRGGRFTAGACAVLFAAFCFVESADLAWVSRNTPRDVHMSFGAFLWTDWWHLPRVLALAAALLVVGAVAAAARRSPPWELPDDMRGAGLLAGFAILALCFLIGNNYMYRWWYALLPMPQLMRWVMAGGRQARWASWMVAGLVLTTWATSEWRLWYAGVALNWLLFAGWVYALASVLLPAALRRVRAS